MLQHQIVQSPARLGLTNPNSPSLQASTPPKLQPSHSQQSFHHQQPQTNLSTATSSSAAAATTTTTSSTLLSLLPPLPRAQSLLLQMASLASKLLELSPSRFASFRGSLPTFLSAQIQALPSAPLESVPSTSKEIVALFTTLQTQLFEAVAELQVILDLQDAKQKMSREIRSKDTSLLGFANKLREAERVLDMLVDDYADYRRPKRSKLELDGEDDSPSATTVASQLKLSDILSYAHRISYTTFAPRRSLALARLLFAGLSRLLHRRSKCGLHSCIISLTLMSGCLKWRVKRKRLSQSLSPQLHNMRMPIRLRTWQQFRVCFLKISRFHRAGNPGCLWSCPPIFLLCRRLDGNLGTRYHCPHWIRFLLLLGLMSNNPVLLPHKDCTRHLKRYRSGMFSWIFWIKMMTVVTIAVTREALMMMIKVALILSGIKIARAIAFLLKISLHYPC